ncbi:DUF5132 domain-containing protein [Desulfomonile tiedjei]|uniref:DUF5132 domain-containing protein n=1 Tax=Desulfomonile tiedjei (strain ATCC 49306 / DSM 6799 / DCB-1) TaxID=706587 RepID=I4C056_DESTA|nr:DUF5132 domain-containing protein [Desulfomonile tiedjei]AFM22947.1 hypothetical protein Desti_0201 [Desulfomonile tiedjei DSM 6799]
MALTDLKPKSSVWTGIAIGVGLLLAPVVVPVVAASMRPLMKAVIRNGYLVYERGREMLEEVTEMTEDIIAEVKSEIETELSARDVEE